MKKPILPARMLVTPQTAEDLRRKDIPLPDGFAVGDSAELRETDILICLRVGDDGEMTLPDNMIADCAWGCGEKVQHRPHAPTKPQKVCLQCYSIRTQTVN